MEKIGLHNYEAFLLDYLEGNLAEPEVAELKLFALTHPELEIDLDLGVLPAVSHEEITFDFKNQLKKTPADLESDLLLDYLEGNLSKEEQALIESKLAINKELASEFKLLKKTILKAEGSLVYTEKNTLYKTEADLVLSNRVIAYYEQLMPPAEKQAFERELDLNVDLKQELDLVSKTRLIIDASVVYPDKSELKRSGRVIALFAARSGNYRTLRAIAASLLLLLSLSLVVTYYTHQPPSPALAKTKEPPAAPTKQVSPGLLQDPVTAAKTLAARPQQAIKNGASALPASINRQPVKQPSLVPTPSLPNQLAENTTTLQPEEAQERKDAPALSATLLADANAVDNQDVIVVRTFASDNSAGQTHALAVLEEGYDDEADVTDGKPKGFWQKAVRVAKKINGLGIKNINGEERGYKNYSVSFNSLTVEKH
jgi:hypothetical protein